MVKKTYFPQINELEKKATLIDVHSRTGVNFTFNMVHYQFHIDKKQYELFPQCCKYHTTIFEFFKKWFDNDFPGKNIQHQKLFDLPEFKKEDYRYIPLLLTRSVCSTEIHIYKQRDKPEWFEEITSFIEGNTHLFYNVPIEYGVPIGLDYYLRFIEAKLLNADFQDKFSITPEKSEKLIRYIYEYMEDVNQRYINRNVKENNNLIQICNKFTNWLNVFPFGFSYFKGLKEIYEQVLPLFKDGVKINKYSGFITGTLHTEESLGAKVTVIDHLRPI